MGLTSRKKCSESGWVNKLLFALNCRESGTVLNLLKRGADVNHVFQKQRGFTPLFIAIKHNNIEMVELLINRGANVDHETDVGETPIFLAIRRRKPKLVRLLVKAGCDLNHKSRKNSCPIFEALRAGKKDIMQMLLENGVNVDCEIGGKTPLAFGVELYGNGCSSAPVTRSQAPRSIRDILRMMIPHIRLNALDTAPIMSQIMLIERNDELVIWKELVRHGSPSEMVNHVYWLNINSRLPAESELFSPELFRLMLHANEFRIHRLPDYGTTVKPMAHNEKILAYIKELTSSPLSLQILSCQSIRRSLFYKRWNRINELNIPAKLKDMILMKAY